ncbi:MAG TPA: hypothetical protein VIK95_09720 [Egibacteraceae bacterium]
MTATACTRSGAPDSSDDSHDLAGVHQADDAAHAVVAAQRQRQLAGHDDADRLHGLARPHDHVAGGCRLPGAQRTQPGRELRVDGGP